MLPCASVCAYICKYSWAQRETCICTHTYKHKHTNKHVCERVSVGMCIYSKKRQGLREEIK